jgi:hypothetical protein
VRLGAVCLVANRPRELINLNSGCVQRQESIERQDVSDVVLAVMSEREWCWCKHQRTSVSLCS